MSFFYPQSSYTNRFPLFDLGHQPDPYEYHPYSSFNPLCLPHPQDDFSNGYHARFPSTPRARLGRDPRENSHGRYNSYPYRGAVSHNPTSHEDSIRAERARRLADAKMRQLAQSKEEEETKVQVTLPNGRQCLVPLSWARRMQSKYPNILNDSMIQPHNPPSPPIRLDHHSASDSDHDSDFYVLDPSQDPSVPSLAATSTIPIRHQSPSPPPPKHSPEELDSAARLIQNQFRTHRSLKSLEQIESAFDQLKADFTYPSPLDLTFSESPQQSPNQTPSKLTFNNHVNRPVQAFEEGLTQLQIKADAVVSGGNKKIRNWRKRLIKDIESQLEQLDRFKNEAWAAQKLAHNQNLSDRPDLKDDLTVQVENESKPILNDSISENPKFEDLHHQSQDEEMSEEITNTDDEDMQGDHSNPCAPNHSSIPLEENLVIPMSAPPATSQEDLVIPAPYVPPSKPASNQSSPQCLITPLVTQDGHLVCPAPVQSHNDDILVSPI